MNEMIKAERNKICSRKQTRMLFLAGVVLIVAYFFFFQFNYQNVFYDYDLEKMALASGFTAIEQRKEVAEIFEGKLSQNTLLTMQEKIDQAKQATVGQDENSAFSAVHVYRDQAAILEYLTNSDGSFKSLETAYPNSPTVTLGYCDGWDKLLSGMGSILSIMICLIVVITLSPVFSEEYALHTDSIIYSARYGRTKLTTSKIIAALEVVIGTYLLYLLLNLVLYGCTYGLQGWNVSIQSSLHYASSIYNLTFLENAGGDCVVVMDCDLQHPPETIVEMYRLWQQGYEVVEGVKRTRGKESVFHKLSAGLFYKLISKAVKIDMSRASDFKLMDRRAVEALLAMPERNAFFRALSSWIGFRTTSVEFDVQEREIGESKWSTKSLIRYAISNIVSFSSAPMTLVTITGILGFLFAVILGIQTLVNYFSGHAVEGFTTVILIILIMGSLILMGLGVIGYYIAKIYEEVKCRPRYIVSRKVGAGMTWEKRR